MSDASLTSQLPSDAELITSARTGDDRAFGELFKRHEMAARAAARSMTRSRADIDDLVAEAFTRVLQALRAGRGPEVAFRPYLLTCVRNAFYDRTRKDKRLEFTDEPEDTLNVSLMDMSASEEDRALIVQAYASLPERWQLALWHTEVEGRSASEVGTLLGIAPNAVAALTYRAREGLRQAYLQAHLQQATPDECQACRPNLGAYVRDGLATRDRRKVDAHLESCEACSGLLIELRETNTHLRAILIPLLLGVPAAKYLGLLSGGKGLIGLFRRSEPKAQAAMGVAAAAAVIAGAIGVAALAGGNPPATAAVPTAAAIVITIPVEPPPIDVDTVLPIETPAPVVTEEPTTPAPVVIPSVPVAVVDPTIPTTPFIPPLLPPQITRPQVPVTPAPTRATTTSTTSTSASTTSTTSTTTTVATTLGTSTTTSSSTSTSTSTPTSSTTTPTTTPSTSTSTTEPPKPEPDLTVGVAPAGPFVAGQFGYVRVTVRNAASAGAGAGAGVLARRAGVVGPAIDPVLTIRLPEGVAVASSTAWVCSAVADGVACRLPTLQPGDRTEASIELSLPDQLPSSMTMTTSITSTAGPTTAGDSRTIPVQPAESASFARIMPGGVSTTGNSVMTCVDTDQCAEAQQGTATGYQNARHRHQMGFVDIDGDPDTFNSAAANLQVPPGATIEYALLTWSGDTSAGDGGVAAPDPVARDLVRFGTPSGWLALTADRVRTPGGTSTAYYATADVTDVVASGGRYWVADVQSGTGKGIGGGRGRFGGWTLIVAFRDTTRPAAYVEVIDQYTTIDGGPTTISADFTGLEPRDGERATTLAWLATEGDRSLAGEVATVNGVTLTNDFNPVGDVFNSSVPTGGLRDPDYDNTLGIDADTFALRLNARDLAMTLSLKSPDDLIRLGAIGLVVEL